jgi:hypothetical protein
MALASDTEAITSQGWRRGHDCAFYQISVKTASSKLIDLVQWRNKEQ